MEIIGSSHANESFDGAENNSVLQLNSDKDRTTQQEKCKMETDEINLTVDTENSSELERR